MASAALAVREIQVLHAPQIADSSDATRARQEKAVAERLSAARGALATVASLREPSAQSQLAAATALLARFADLPKQMTQGILNPHLNTRPALPLQGFGRKQPRTDLRVLVRRSPANDHGKQHPGLARQECGRWRTFFQRAGEGSRGLRALMIANGGAPWAHFSKRVRRWKCVSLCCLHSYSQLPAAALRVRPVGP